MEQLDQRTSLQRKYALVTDGSTKIPIIRNCRTVSTPTDLSSKHKLPLQKQRLNGSSPSSSTPTGRRAISVSAKLMTPENQASQTRISTPPSTMTRLSSQFANLSLKTPSPSPSKVLETISANNNDSHLESRTSSLLKARVRGKALSSPKRRTSTSKPLISGISSTLASPTKASLQRVTPATKPKEDPPLVRRLTRSTTISNLKVRKERVVSESSIPKPQPTAKKVVSGRQDITRPTRSSQLKKDASMHNLKLPPLYVTHQSKPPTQESSLALPKRRSMMTKSFSVNSSLKDLRNATSVQPPRAHRGKTQKDTQVLRKISEVRQPRTLTPRRRNAKCRSSTELYALMKPYHRTEKVLASWGQIPQVPQPNPVEPSQVAFTHKLNAYETAEIRKHTTIYYLGNVGTKRQSGKFDQNFGFDDEENNLVIEKNDHIGYRYQVLSRLGTGAFGNVYKCFDHQLRHVVSLKIMRNDPTWSLQSMYEIKILKQLSRAPAHLLQYCEYFNFRSHICVSTELLSVNLIEALGATRYQGFDTIVIQKWSVQLLSALKFLHDLNIVHADLKPENIMLITPHSLDLKIIDFGSSTTVGDITYPYIQSRFYRAPEVLVGARYDTKIDIWSFGAVIAEMYIGRPLFEARDEHHLYRLFVKLIGHPTTRTVLAMRDEVFKKGSVNRINDTEFVDKSTMLFGLFNRMGTYRGEHLETPRSTIPFNKRLEIDDVALGEFLKTVFIWNPEERPSASKLLEHSFLRDAC